MWMLPLRNRRFLQNLGIDIYYTMWMLPLRNRRFLQNLGIDIYYDVGKEGDCKMTLQFILGR
jgi:hypothetical protein